MYTHQQIVDIVLTHLGKVDATLKIHKDSDLGAMGLLDSLASMEIYLYIEKQFDIKIPESEITLDTLYSASTIADLVIAHLPTEVAS